ncbi:hypothetical protein LL251_17185 [Sphingobium naphthae]|nr:hypothetical protein [Sphingobium naphthae]
MNDITPQALADIAQAARDLRAHAQLGSPHPTAQASALITAAALIIEAEVGVEHASGALLALIEPTMADWMAATRAAAGEQPHRT